MVCQVRGGARSRGGLGVPGLGGGCARSQGGVCLVGGSGIPACTEADPPVNRMNDRHL